MTRFLSTLLVFSLVWTSTVQAFFVCDDPHISATTTMATSLAQHGGNPIAATKAVVSKNGLKRLAISGVAALVTCGLEGAFEGAAAAETFADKTLSVIKTASIKVASQASANVLVEGRADVDLRTVMGALVSSVSAEMLEEIAPADTFSSAAAYAKAILSQGAGGAIALDSRDGFIAGALGAIAGQMAANTLKDQVANASCEKDLADIKGKQPLMTLGAELGALTATAMLSRTNIIGQENADKALGIAMTSAGSTIAHAHIDRDIAARKVEFERQSNDFVIIKSAAAGAKPDDEDIPTRARSLSFDDGAERYFGSLYDDANELSLVGSITDSELMTYDLPDSGRLSPVSEQLTHDIESAQIAYDRAVSSGGKGFLERWNLSQVHEAFDDRQALKHDLSLHQNVRDFASTAATAAIDTALFVRDHPVQSMVAVAECAPGMAGASVTGTRASYEYALGKATWYGAASETAFAAVGGKLVMKGAGLVKKTWSAAAAKVMSKPNVQALDLANATRVSSSFNTLSLVEAKAMLQNPKYFQKHHIVSDKFKETKNHALWKAAGMTPNDPSNFIQLPTNKGAQYGSNVRSIHQGRHLGEVNEHLAEKMTQEYQKGIRQGWTQSHYADALKQIIHEERHVLKSGVRMLNKNARPHAETMTEWLAKQGGIK